MAVREFKDNAGREWRAWDVAPDEMSAQIKNEAYLAELYYTGWIAFETKTGDEKRRLYPVPEAWSELPDRELEILLDKSERVSPRKPRR
jgi:hypothetical protein